MARKRGEKTWFTSGSRLVLDINNEFLDENQIVDFPEGELPSATLRLVRLLGSLTVFVENHVQGDNRGHLWLGLYGRNAQHTGGGAQKTRIIQRAPGGLGVTDNDDNDWWLWRQPFPLFPCNFHYGEASDDSIRSYTFDWPIRGGRGTKIDSGQALFIVAEIAAGNLDIPTFATSVKVDATYLELYAGSSGG